MTPPQPTSAVLDEATQHVPIPLAELAADAKTAGVRWDLTRQHPAQLDPH